MLSNALQKALNEQIKNELYSFLFVPGDVGPF